MTFTSMPFIINIFEFGILKRFERILSRIPGTKRYRRRIQKLIIEDARQYLKSFDDLNAIAPEVKQDLKRRIRHCENKRAAIDSWSEISEELLEILYYSIVIISFLIAPFVTGYWLFPYTLAEWVEFVLAYVIIGYLPHLLFLALPIIPIVIFRKLQDFLPRRLIITFFLVWVIAITTTFGVSIYQNLSISPSITTSVVPTLPTHAIIAGRLAVFGLGLAILLIYFSRIIVEFTQQKLFASHYPDILIIHGLLRILSMTEKEPEHWGELEFKRELLPQLEIVAQAISKYLPRRLRSGDSATDNWFQDMTKKTAAAIRELKKWVIMSKSDTRQEFISRIADSLVNATYGSWDSLQRVESPKLTRSQFLYRVSTFIKTLFVAILPFVTFWIIQQTPLMVDQPIADYITLGTIIWAVLTLLTTVDPLFNDKLDTLKNIVQLFPTTSSKSKKSP